MTTSYKGMIVSNKGGPGSGNIGHAGRPGEVGGSASSVVVYNSIQEMIDKDRRSEMFEYKSRAFFADTDGKIYALSDTSMGGHTEIAKFIVQQDKTNVDEEVIKKWGDEVAIVRSDKYIRVELSPTLPRGTLELNLESAPFTTKHLRIMQTLIRPFSGDVEDVFIDGWKAYDERGVITQIGHSRFSIDEFLRADKIIIRNDIVQLKQAMRVIKGSPSSGNFGHAGRPGKIGGSAPSAG